MTVWTNPVFHTILMGTADPHSQLARLRGHRDCLQLIFQNLSNQWRAHIEKSTGYKSISMMSEFPEPMKSSFGQKIEYSVNMMPIIMGERTSLPSECERYFTLILRCLESCPDEFGKIGYLTVHESFVEKGSSQRRPGLHTESPGKIRVGEGEKRADMQIFRWGWGRCTDAFNGGIFMASNTDDACAIWDLVIDQHDQVVGKLGDIEFLRDILEGEDFRSSMKMVQANELIWLTDRTPHESVPLAQGCFRQYFRLVTSKVSAWYEQHSTKNPLGVLPSTSIIIQDNKFLQ